MRNPWWRLPSFLAVAYCMAVSGSAQTFDPSTLRPLGYHPSGIAYYNVPYFADAFAQGGEWLAFSGSEFGTHVDTRSAQFDENGLPRLLLNGLKLRAVLFGLNIENEFRPPGWPSRATLTRGRVLLTWKGRGDLRLVGGEFLAEGSSTAETGEATDGRRFYMTSGPGQSTQTLEIHAISAPLTEIHVWLPQPDDPSTAAKENELATLENHRFHPIFLQRLADADWSFIRFMDWGATNASPQRDWTDRRIPSHGFKTGVLNPGSPGGGSEGNRETGVAFEEMVRLANDAGKPMWINVPHLATDDFIRKLAQLIRFGSDGRNPYEAQTANPIHPPLRSDLRVFVEYSNEIWSSGYSFPQGDWAESEAAAVGLSKPQFNARRFAQTWRIFQQVFGGTDRLVRVAAVFTGLEAYTRPFLQELGSYGLTLSPQVRPDVMAVTTYFGNGIQDYVDSQRFAEGRQFDDAYWTGATFAAHRAQAFDEWTRRLLSGDSAQGGGFDTTGVGGGFSLWLRDLPRETLGYSLPIVAYEGGPSLYTDSIDGGATDSRGVPTDDHVTTFIEAMNRDPRMAPLYDIHLNLARAKGLRTHTPFTDAGLWSKYGQWGHLETLDQRPDTAVKYAAMLAHDAEFRAIRSIDDPRGAVPRFVPAEALPVAIVGQPYSTDIPTAGGEGARTVKVIGTHLPPGLSVSQPASDTVRVSGNPARSQRSFLFARVTDADGDPAWRIFTLESFGGAGTLVQSDFRGSDPALHTPWSATYVLSPKVRWSGWSGGSVSPGEGDNAFVFSLSAPDASEESLAQAIAENEFIRATVTPVSPLDLRGAEVRFSTRGIGYHCPRGFAFATSIQGFAEGSMLYVSAPVEKGVTDEVEHRLLLPSTAAYASITAPFEIRIYAWGAQFEGHATSLSAFKLTEVSGRRRPVRR
jgi:hypothetical protein